MAVTEAQLIVIRLIRTKSEQNIKGQQGISRHAPANAAIAL
jgi:hypothetical protein